MLLSVVIRNLNEEENLRQTLTALRKQLIDFDYEVIVVDNESDDNSVQVAESMGCKVVSLKRETFTFGHALNVGIAHSSGELLFILSAHVILLNEFFLKNIPGYFNDKKVAGLRFVLSNVAHGVANSIEKGIQQLVYKDDADFVVDNWNNFIVNHCSAIRRSVWEAEPFDEKIPDSEDKLWSLNVLKKNHVILYNVPGFYVYTKQLVRSNKIASQARSLFAKEMVTKQKDKLFAASYLRSMLLKLSSELKQLKTQLAIHHHIYKTFKALQKTKQDQ